MSKLLYTCLLQSVICQTTTGYLTLKCPKVNGSEGWKDQFILHFCIFEVKEAVEVIMADGAKEATEVVRFTLELEFNNIMA